MMTIVGRKRAVWMAGLFLSLGASVAWAQGPLDGPGEVEIRYEPEAETLGITATSVPLQDALAAITEETGIVFVLPPGMNPTITRVMDPLPLERAIKQLLDLSSRNSAMIYVGSSDSISTGRNRYLLTEVRVLEGGGKREGQGGEAGEARGRQTGRDRGVIEAGLLPGSEGGVHAPEFPDASRRGLQRSIPQSAKKQVAPSC